MKGFTLALLCSPSVVPCVWHGPLAGGRSVLLSGCSLPCAPLSSRYYRGLPPFGVVPAWQFLSVTLPALCAITIPFLSSFLSRRLLHTRSPPHPLPPIQTTDDRIVRAFLVEEQNVVKKVIKEKEAADKANTGKKKNKKKKGKKGKK